MSPGDRFVAASVSTERKFVVGDRTDLFRSEGFIGSYAPHDVSDDGRAFLLLERRQPQVPTLRVTRNWYEEFRDREQD